MVYVCQRDLTRYVIVAALLIMIAQPLVLVMGDTVNYGLIVLGSRSCPHCQSLHNFFESTYQGVCLFLWLENIGTDLFYEIASVEINYGLSKSYAGATPHTLVFNNGTLVAIVIGAVESKVFWDELMRSGATDLIPVYIGDSIQIRIPRNALSGFMAELEATLNMTSTPQPTTTGAGTNAGDLSNASVMIGVLFIFTGVLVLLAYVITRRRH
ncbi:MAG: hypothetical protein QXP80_00845 [Zestosphaera sp.]